METISFKKGIEKKTKPVVDTWLVGYVHVAEGCLLQIAGAVILSRIFFGLSIVLD